jgi:two-component system chemotaxis response regulator CheB
MLGIILTGASADGAAGLAVVRRQGGLAWVQDPAGAMVATMPAAALALAGADRVLSLEQMAAELARLGPAPGAASRGDIR